MAPFLPAIPIADKLLRTLVVYVFLLLVLRLFGKRELGQLNPFDLVVLLLLSNTVHNAIIGPDDTLSGGLIGAFALVVINWIVVRFLFRHPDLAKIVEGESDCLIDNGKILYERLKHETITVAEIELAARRQGFASLDDVEKARLEVGGALTFIAKHPTEEEERHREVLARIDRLATAQEELVKRLNSIQGTPGH
jgi:uncharacterized membrane protein YcaP (DUF421 family)